MGRLESADVQNQLLLWNKILSQDIRKARDGLNEWVGSDLKSDIITWEMPEPIERPTLRLMIQILERMYEHCQAGYDDFQFSKLIEERLDSWSGALLRNIISDKVGPLDLRPTFEIHLFHRPMEIFRHPSVAIAKIPGTGIAALLHYAVQMYLRKISSTKSIGELSFSMAHLVKPDDFLNPYDYHVSFHNNSQVFQESISLADVEGGILELLKLGPFIVWDRTFSKIDAEPCCFFYVKQDGSFQEIRTRTSNKEGTVEVRGIAISAMFTISMLALTRASDDPLFLDLAAARSEKGNPLEFAIKGKRLKVDFNQMLKAHAIRGVSLGKNVRTGKGRGDSPVFEIDLKIPILLIDVIPRRKKIPTPEKSNYSLSQEILNFARENIKKRLGNPGKSKSGPK